MVSIARCSSKTTKIFQFMSEISGKPKGIKRGKRWARGVCSQNMIAMIFHARHACPLECQTKYESSKSHGPVAPARPASSPSPGSYQGLKGVRPRFSMVTTRDQSSKSQVKSERPKKAYQNLRDMTFHTREPFTTRQAMIIEDTIFK